MISIAVLGYGTVGSGVIEVLNTNGRRIDQRAGEEIRVKYVLDIRDFPGDPIQKKIVHDFETIVKMCIRDRYTITTCSIMAACLLMRTAASKKWSCSEGNIRVKPSTTS